MKKAVFLLEMLCAIYLTFSMNSCDSSDEELFEPSLEISGENEFSAEGGKCIVNVTSNAEWDIEIEKGVDWLIVNEKTDNQVVITVKNNPLADQRTSQITIKLKKYSKSDSFAIKQEGKITQPQSLHIENRIFTIEEEGGECAIDITNGDEVDWNYSIEKKEGQEIDWLTEKSRTPQTLLFEIKKNDINEERKCTITIVNNNNEEDKVTVTITQSACSTCGLDDIVARGYVLQSSMQGDASLVGKDYREIHSYMRKYGWDYSEHPNSSVNDHKDGIHCQNIFDEVLQQYVFKFMAHIDPVLDGDRGKIADRQRNEMRTQSTSKWSKMNGNVDDKQVLRWKFKIPKGFRPSTSFTHIHQLKAEEGDNSTRPLITLTLRGSNNGTKRRLQIIHNGKSGVNKDDKIVDNIPIEDFEDEWVQVEEEIHYNHNGSFRIKIIRIKDNKVLMDYSNDNIDMWRSGAKNVRNKYGIYRSFGKKLNDPSERPSNGIKDESFYIADLYTYKKDSKAN